jgi:cobalamin biosynthesis Co2+ chelatase CbiK
VVDLLEAVVRQQISEVRLTALFLIEVDHALEDSQSRSLFDVWDVEFPELVLELSKLAGKFFFKFEPSFGRVFCQ